MSYSNNQGPLVSVVIPTSNGAQTIGAVLESLASQDYQNIEIIIIDNGSTDNTENVVKSFMSRLSKPVKYFKYPDKLGHAGAINEGIRKASGDVIIVLHDDVVLCQRNWISSMLEILNKDNVGVASSLFITDPGELSGINKAFAYIYILGWHKPVVKISTQEVLYTGLNNDVIKREVIERVGLMDETYKYSIHDIDFSEKVRRIGYKIVLNPKVCAKHILSSHQRSLKSHLIKAWQYGFPSGIILKRYGYLPNIDNMYLIVSLIMFALSLFNINIALLISAIFMAISFIVEPPNYYGKSKHLIRLRKILVNIAGAIIFLILFKGTFFIIPLLGGASMARAILSSFNAFREQHDVILSLLVLVFHPIWSLINGVAVLAGIPWFLLKKSAQSQHNK
jgi:glycosyltransferase involved in cell wall biosynthesis